MTREDFIKFVDKALDELILYTELHTNKNDINGIDFSWLEKTPYLLHDRKEIIESIVSKVFVSENKIYPCVDFQILNIIGTRIGVKGWIANFEPRSFMNGRSRPGPFNYLIKQELISPSVKSHSKQFVQTLKEKGLVHFV